MLGNFVPAPTGISRINFLTPRDSFFVRIDGIIRPTGSMCKGRSISISTLSAGEVARAPPQIIQAFSFEIISFNFLGVKETGAKTSIESAVPDGEVIALVEDLGMVRPVAATIGTIIRETLFPGTPPFSKIYEA